MKIACASLVAILAVAALATAGSADRPFRLVQYDLVTNQLTVLDPNYSHSGTGSAAASSGLAYYDTSGVYFRSAQTGVTTKLSSDRVTSGFSVNDKYIKWNGSVMNLATQQVYTADAAALLGSGSSDYVYTTTALTNLVSGATTTVSGCQGANATSYLLVSDVGYNDYMGWHGTGYKLTLVDAVSGSTLKTKTVSYAYPHFLYSLGNCSLTDEWMVLSYHLAGFGIDYFHGESIVGDDEWSEAAWDGYPRFAFDGHSVLTSINRDCRSNVIIMDMVTGLSRTLEDYTIYGYDMPYVSRTALGGNYAYWVDNVPEPSSLIALGSLTGACLVWMRRRRA